MAELERQVESAPVRSKRTRRIGTVVGDRGQKTIKVEYAFTTKHPKYHKYIKRTTRLQAHDENNEAKVGDVVEVMSCRRLSKTKSWRLVRIVTSY
ncbi:MAG: 30S ribosomal protein S17 [Phycisphaerae bacterium]